MKTPFVALVSLCGILCGSTDGHATDLRVVSSNAEVEVSVDVDSIKVNPEESYTEVVVMTIYSHPQKAPDVQQFNGTMSRLFLRCWNATGSISSLVFFEDITQNSSSHKKFTYDVNWRSVDHTSDVGYVWKYVCTQQWKNK